MNFILILTSLLSITPIVEAADDSDCVQFWTAIDQANSHFEKAGDVASAKSLIQLLPANKKQTPLDCKEQDDTIDFMITHKKSRIALLKNQPELGYTLYFRLRHLSGGAFAESLDADLADSMVTTPELFLKNLKEDNGDIYCPTEIVRAIGSISLKPAAQNAKLKERVEALKKVKNGDLEELREDCIQKLKTET